MHFIHKYMLLVYWLLIGFLLLQSKLSLAAELHIAIIYPVVEKPYSTVFEQIIDGVVEQSHSDVSQYGLDEINTEQTAALQEWLALQQPDVVIALGRRGIEGVRRLELTVPVVFSGVLYASKSTANQSHGISLTPDPALLFNQLKRLSPKTKRIFVVYNPTRYQWLIDLAKKEANSAGLTLIAEIADSLRESAKLHRNILRNANNTTDSLWLLQDPGIVATNTILPMILKESWNKKLLVFSSNPGDVPRGALFSYYSDNKALGHNLARLAASALNSDYNSSYSIAPLTSALSAINIRTAGHIGLQIPFEEQRKFSLVFPRK